jgi:hypothetical protein
VKWWRFRPPPDSLDKWINLGKHIVEIVAVFVAGWWTYTRFIQTEEPAQRKNFVTEQQMQWAASPSPMACYGILSLAFQNVSKAEVKIAKVVQRAWLLPLPAFAGQIEYVDPEVLDDAIPADSSSYTDGPFVQEYPPQAKVRYDLVWTMRRAPGIALFRIDLFADSTDSEPTEWAYDWDEICGGADSSETSAAVPLDASRSKAKANKP